MRTTIVNREEAAVVREHGDAVATRVDDRATALAELGDGPDSDSIGGNDSAGRVTVGGSTNGGRCTITFVSPWPNPPIWIWLASPLVVEFSGRSAV